MRKILSLMMMMFASIALVFADEPVQIASGTFNGKNATYTEGWSTTGTGVGRTDCIIIGADENITSPEVDLSLYESISIAIKARRYGSLSGSKAEIAVTFDGEAIGNTTASGTSATTALDVINYTVNDLSTGNFVITCTNATSAGSSHGAGINSIVITGVLKSQGGGDPQPAHTYTVAGNDATLFGTAWTPSLEANDMTLVEGLYTWEKTEQTLDAGTIQFKVCEDHDWAVAYPAQNYQLNIAEAGVYTIKITYNPEGNAVNAVASKTGDVDPGETPAHTYTVAGSDATLFGTAWEPQVVENDMVLVEGLYTWEKTEQTLDAGTIQFKVCQDHAWTTSYPEQNYQLNIAEAGVYTIKITYNPEGNVVNAVATKTGDVDPEEPGEIVLPVVKLAGSLTSWSEPALMVNAEDSLSATLTLNLGIDHYQLKVVSDDNWLSKAGDGDLFTMHRDYPHVDHLNLVNTGDNIKLITDVEGEYTFTWTYADSTLVVTFPEAPAQPKFYITGGEDIVGEGHPTWGKNGALESFSDTLVMNLAAGFHKFKLITPAEQWLGMEALTDTAYGLFTDDDTNICFNIAEAGEVTVIYNATEFKVEGDFYIAPVANYYLIGDSAFVVDAGATADKAWTPDAIPSFQDTTVLNLKAGVNYIMRLSLEGTWENHRDFRHLTDTAAGLIELPDEFENHSIGFSLAEAGEVTIIYIPAANEQPEVFKLIGNFYVAPAPDPTVGVRGSMNDWAEEPIPFVLSADKTYASLTVEHIGAGEYEFKFLINGDYRSNGYRFHREFTGAAGITTDNDANMIFEADVDGEYTFYWYFANDSLGIVYPEYIEPAKEYYAKYADAWTWVKLTEAEGLWLTDTIVYKGVGININDKAADENNMFYSNTVEEEGVRPIAGPAIDVNDTIYFTFNPADSVVTAVMVGKYVAPVEETKDIVIVPGAWEGLHLGAWAWVDGEAGAWYPVVLDNEQLIATIPAAADRIIVATFAEGAELNWDNKINQTPDQVIDACGVLYINSNTPTWCEQGGFVEELYTIAGSGSILGVDWDQTAAINDMVFNAETGIYTLVKENLTLTAFEYQYKVAKDHVWNAGQYPASGNQVLAITEDGIYNVTFTFNPAIPLLTAEAEKIQDIVVEKHYLVVGQDMIANGEDWNNDTDINLMTTADEGLTYTLTVNGAELVADASYRYKIVEKGTWNEYFPNIGGDDASFTVEEDGIYTITYTYTVATSQCDVQATKTAELPEARLTDGYYIVGTFSAVDAWTVDDLTEDQRFVEYNTDEFGTYYSLTVDLAEGDQFKVVQVIHDAIVLWMPEGDGNNMVIDANHAGVAKNIYLNIMVDNSWDCNVEPNLYNGYYLLGTMNDWTPSADYMLGVDETCAEGELMLVTTFAQNDALKVAYVYNGVATQWYPGEGIADYVIDANHAGETSIYFRYDGQGSSDWYYGFFYVIPLSHTDIDNVNAAGEATKILRDGQILIIKGEKMYNVMGQTIK